MAIPTDILRLSISERIQLVEDIWDSITDTPEQLVVTEAQQHELDRRIELYRQDPAVGVTWPELQQKLTKLP